MKKIILALTIVSALLACNTENKKDSSLKETVDNNIVTDLIEPEKEIADVDTLAIDSTLIKNVEELPKAAREIFVNEDVKEAAKDITEKFGVQWDFCSCVNKMDSVNEAMMEEGLPDSLFNILMERSDFIDSKCKLLLATPNTTPAERAAHQAAINACKKSK